MKKKYWILIIALVIALAAAVAVGILLTGGEPEPEGFGVTEPSEGGVPAETGDYKVTFYANDGSVLKIDYVDEGESATPPKQPQMLYGAVFCAWDTDFTEVKGDLEIRPVCEEVKDKTNVLAVEGVYGTTGGTVVVPVRLCGQVCVSGLDMTVSYDPEALELLSVTEDGGVVYNGEKPGKVRLNFASGENAEADVDLCYLEFAVKAQPGALPVTLEVHNIYAFREKLESNVDTMYKPEHTVINGTVFALQGGTVIEES